MTEHPARVAPYESVNAGATFTNPRDLRRRKLGPSRANAPATPSVSALGPNRSLLYDAPTALT